MPDSPPSRANPYPGPRSFQPGETLYGRDRQVRELLDLLIAERIVLLYSPSGAGKTSLIQAALIPEIESEGFQVLPVMRPNLHLTGGQAGAQSNGFVHSLVLSLEDHLARDQQRPPDELAGLSFDQYLATWPVDATAWSGQVLIFDQFEEILSTRPTDQAAKVEFFEQVGQALRNRNRWALFSMREEFIAALDPYLRLIPTHFATTYRLDLLSAEGAKQAMQQPCAAQQVAFTDAAALKLVDDLRTIRVQQADLSTGLALGDFVEPVQLQVVCRRLWDKLPPDHNVLDVTDVAEVGDVDSALRSYYADAVAAAAAQTGERERSIRDWIESQLITDQGIRGQVLQCSGQSQGLDSRTIDVLVDTHLLRAEQRRGATWFELSHDRLINPIRADNAAWRQTHLSELQRRAALWEQEARPRGLLLQGPALVEAERWAASHPEAMESSEQEFLAACREAQAIADRERRQARYIRWLAIGATAFSIVAIILAAVAVTERQKAQASSLAELHAKATAISRLHAVETAEAEALISARTAQSAQVTAVAERENAETQKRIAQSRQGAAIASDALHRGNGPLALLQSVRAFQVADTVEAENVMHEALAAWRGRGVMGLHRQRISGLGVSPDSRFAVTSAEEELRLWELDGERRTIALRGHTAPVTDVKISPDSRYVASASRDGTGRLWDSETGRQIWQVPVPTEGLAAAFDPRGQRVAFGGDDGRITVWQIEPLSKTATLQHDSYGIPLQIAFSPDGQSLLAAYSDNVARIWRGGQAIRLEGHAGIVRDAAFNPNGSLIATASDDNTVRLWDAQSGQQLDVSTGTRDLQPRLKWSPDGNYLAGSSRANVAYLWEINANQIVDPPSILAGHTGPVDFLAFSADGRWLATGSSDGTAKLWDLGSRTSRATFAGHTDHIENISFSPDGELLVTTARDQTVRLWDPQLDRGGELAMKRYGSAARLAGLAAQGEQIVSVAGGEAHVWEPATGQQRAFDVGADPVEAAALSADGTRLAVADAAGQVRLWDVARGQRAAGQPPSDGVLVRSLAFDPSGRFLAMARDDGTIAVWNAGTAKLETTLPASQDGVNAVSFDPAGARLAAGSADGRVSLWNWRQGEAVRSWQLGAQPVRAVSFSPNGAYLAAADHGGRIRVWTLASTTSLDAATLRAGAPVRALAFSQDSETLATGDEQGTTTLWHWRSGEPVLLSGHRRWVTGLAFLPDGQRLASAGQDGTVRIWPSSMEATLALACSRLQNERPAATEPDVDDPASAAACQGLPTIVWTEAGSISAPQSSPAVGSQLPKPSLPTIYYFEALPGTRIVQGKPLRLRWDLENAQWAYLYAGDEERGVTAPYEETLNPQQSTTYRLVAGNDLGTVERAVSVTVVHP